MAWNRPPRSSADAGPKKRSLSTGRTRSMNDAVRSMRAMRASNSDPASLTSESIPVPDPGPGELLVQVRATAITADELTWPESWPAIPCHDVSGVVAATGPGTDGWQAGDEVYGLVGFDRPGAAAEYVTAHAADLAPKPASVDHLAAAAIPLGALTAWQALHEHAKLAPGQHVLVHGGAGGVGAYVTQLAAQHGARVTATASAGSAPMRSSTTPAGSRTRSATWTWWSTRWAAPPPPGPGRSCAAAGSWSTSRKNRTRPRGAATTSVACTSWSSPTAGSCGNWPAWSTRGSCARSCPRCSG